MKFTAKTKAETLLDWLRAIHAVTDECILLTSELDVVEVRAVDPANALMISMRMPDHAWDFLEVEAGSLGIAVERLIETVEMFDPTADLAITSEHQKLREWLRISDDSDAFGLEMPDLANMRKPPAEPNIGELPATFVLDAALLQQKVRRAESVGDNLLIGVDSDGSVRVWTATDHDYYRGTLPEGGLAEVAISGQGVRSMFAIDYMRETVAAMRGEVLVHLGQDKSVRMSFTLHDANVTYIQAPRTE